MNFYVRFLCFAAWCFISGNPQSLQNVRSTLSSLAASLHYDIDIQNDINSLAHDGNEVFLSFHDTIKMEGGKILTENNRLVKTSNPTDVKVDALRKALNAARTSLQSEHKDIVSLERDIHSSLEMCRSRRIEHDTKRKNVDVKLALIPREISTLDNKIGAHDDSVRNLEQSANDLDGRAEYLRRAAKKKKKKKKKHKRLVGKIGGIVGVALAPFTGGASLAIATAAAGIHAVINLNDAHDCSRNARHFRDNANSKRQQAQKLRENRNKLQAERNNLETEIRRLQTSSDELKQAEQGLKDVSGYLRSSTVIITDLLLDIENMDTAIKNAEIHSNSFEIIQNAFSRNPEKLEKSSQTHLDTLKDKWQRLAQVLMKYGAKAALT